MFTLRYAGKAGNSISKISKPLRICIRCCIICLMIISAFLTLSACVPDVSEYNYILDHWKGDWSGWYEITNASGSYESMEGLKKDCTAEISMDPKTRLWMGFFGPDGEKIGDFTGVYRHREGSPHGESWFFEYTDDQKNTVDADIPLNSSEEGDQVTADFSGRIGSEEEGMDIHIHLVKTAETD